MPENRLPDGYGVDDQEIPTEIGRAIGLSIPSISRPVSHEH
jgi:hypothetical protein